MRILVGPVNGPGTILGLSESNLQLVNIAAMFLATPMMAVTGVVFFILKPRQKWWTLAPAILIPVLGACAFGFFLLSGLTT